MSPTRPPTAADPPPPFPALRTQRLLLREIGAADIPALYEIHGDAETMRWFGSEPVTDIAGAARLVELFAGWRTQPNPGVRWGLQKKGCDTLIGSCGLFAWNRHWARCSLGYELARGAQGQGLMQEALGAALAWGFEHMALNRVEALVHPMNAPSLQLLQRLGFVQEGTLREAARWGGQFHDMRLLSLLKSQWVAPEAPGAPT